MQPNRSYRKQYNEASAANKRKKLVKSQRDLDRRTSDYDAKKAAVNAKEGELYDDIDSLNSINAQINKKSADLSRHLMPAQPYAGVSGVLQSVSGLVTGNTASARAANIGRSSEELDNLKIEAARKQKEIVAKNGELQSLKAGMNDQERKLLDKEWSKLQAERQVRQDELDKVNDVINVRDRRGMDTEAHEAEAGRLTRDIEQIDEKRRENSRAKEQNSQRSRQRVGKAEKPCALACKATSLSVTCSHNRKAKFNPATNKYELHVISASYAGKPGRDGNRYTHKKQATSISVDTIEVAVEGVCNQGLDTVSTMGRLPTLLERRALTDHCPVVSASGASPGQDILLPANPATPLEINAYSPPIDTLISFCSAPTWVDFFRHVVRPDKKATSEYTLTVNGCDGGYEDLSAVIYSSPKYTWDGSVSIGWNQSAEDPVVDNGTSCELVEEQVIVNKWKAEGKISGTIDTKSFELVPFGVDGPLDAFRGTFSQLFTWLERLNKNLELDGEEASETQSSSADGKEKDASGPKIQLPKIVIGGNYENKENPNTHEIDEVSKFYIKMDPLIGVNLKVDILKFLLDSAMNCIAPGSASGARSFQKYVKQILLKVEEKRAKETGDDGNQSAEEKKNYVKAEVELILETSGSIKGELAWEQKEGGQLVALEPQGLSPNANEGAIAIEFKIHGQVKAEFKCTAKDYEVLGGCGFGVMAGGARKAGASELAFKMNAAVEGGGKVVRGRASYNGLTIYYMVYSEFAVERTDTSDKKKVTTTRRKGKASLVSSKKQKEKSGDSSLSTKGYKELWNIIGERSFPLASNDAIRICGF
ncbi:Uncharacterised protein [BD1-7 clade bacterium]|uniref:Uncharacterized protein n=1 Tax=BD1-7 clade bacterium TaxID=2029982 RepID=A0A5S9QVS1_9GAMM|nr:Uncharacterised protein [BD1-7 clade bacterium]